MGKKQGNRDIEENRKNEKRKDMIINNVINDDTIMNKKNRTHLGGYLFQYKDEKYPTMKLECAYLEFQDGSKVENFDGFYVVFCKCRIMMRDGITLGVMKAYLSFVYNRNMLSMPINQAEEILDLYINAHHNTI